MQNENENLLKANAEVGAFDQFFGILKSNKNVSLEEMDNAGRERAMYRLGGLPPFHIPEDFDKIELPEFYESEIFPK